MLAFRLAGPVAESIGFQLKLRALMLVWRCCWVLLGCCWVLLAFWLAGCCLEGGIRC